MKLLLGFFVAGLGFSKHFKFNEYNRVASPDPYYISPSSQVVLPQNKFDPYVPITGSVGQQNYQNNRYVSNEYNYKNINNDLYKTPQHQNQLYSNNYQGQYNQYNQQAPNIQYHSYQNNFALNKNIVYPANEYQNQYPTNQYPNNQYQVNYPGNQYVADQYPGQYSNLRTSDNIYENAYSQANKSPQILYQGNPENTYTNNYQTKYVPTIYYNKNDQICKPPRAIIGGLCRCPNDRIYVSGNCIERKTPPSNCYPPRALIKGECICPNNEIYISQNNCVPNNDKNNMQFEYNINYEECKPPRVLTVNKYCLCQNNGMYTNGQCILNIDYNNYAEPLYSQKDFDTIATLGRNFRQFDGTKNNLQNPEWGSKGQLLQRRAPAYYSDGVEKPFAHLPSARVLSNQLADLGYENILRSIYNITTITTFFGQFVDHDLDLIQFQNTENMNIQIPFGDKFFKDQTQLKFTRSGFAKKNGIRMHKNIVTSWIDGNQIYGSDLQTSRNLRLFSNGKLKTSIDNMLPREPNLGLFLAGDIRANENVMLSALHTVFMRQHNRICDQIKSTHPQLNDEEIFRSARQWVIGLLQKITVEQYVPILLGDQYYNVIGRYTGYKSHINPNIPTQFATAAYRVGHSLLIDTYPFINKNGINYQNTRLTDLFANPKYINSDKIEDALRGLARTLQKQKSIKVSDQVRNWLVLDPANKQIKLDLVSLNLQRGRDHGLPTYNQARLAYGLRRIAKFDDLQTDPIRAEKMKKVYNNNIDDVELFIGIISETPVKNGILGQLGCRIVGQTFRNLRDGDRFWYQSAYPKNIVSKIKKTTLTDIIRRNTKINQEIQDDIWHYFERVV